MADPLQGVVVRPGFAEATPVTYNGPPSPPPSPRSLPISGPPPTNYNYAVDETGAFWVDETGANMMSE